MAKSANYPHKQNMKEICNYYTGFLRLNYDDDSEGDDDFVSSDENYTEESPTSVAFTRHDLWWLGVTNNCRCKPRIIMLSGWLVPWLGGPGHE